LIILFLASGAIRSVAGRKNKKTGGYKK